MLFQRPAYGLVRGVPTFPNPSQMAFHANRSPFKLFRAGVGSGKTHAGAEELIGKALANGPNKMYLIGAPSHPILDTATFPTYERALRRWQSHNGRKLHAKVTRSPQKRQITLRGNIVLRFVCLRHPDDFAGPTIAGYHVDEAALLEDGMAAHGMLTERLRDADAGSLFGIYTTTPRGPVGIVHHFGRQIAEGNPDYFEVTGSTHENLANLGEGFIQRVVAGKSDRQIRQQLYAEVLDYAGAVYAGAFDSRASCAIGFDPRKHLKHCSVYLAIDWGPTYPHVLWVAHDAEADRDVVFAELAEDNVGHQELLERAVTYGKERFGLLKHDYSGVYADRNPASANRIARQFFRIRGENIPVYGKVVNDNADLLDGIEVVSSRLWSPSENTRRLFFAPDLFDSPNPRGIIQCMRLYKWAERRVSSTTVLDLRPEKGLHDHGPDALRYYNWRRYKTQRFEVAARAASYDEARRAA